MRDMQRVEWTSPITDSKNVINIMVHLSTQLKCQSQKSELYKYSHVWIDCMTRVEE
jgi:hypothetical protein